MLCEDRLFFCIESCAFKKDINSLAKNNAMAANRTFMSQTHGLNLYNAAIMHIDCIISYPI